MSITVNRVSDRDLTVQGNQAARSRALTHLLELPNMPTVSLWSVDAALNYLYGMVFPREDPAETRRTIEAWAAFLHTSVEESVTADVITVAADGLCEYGVRVRISTQFPAEIKEAAA